MCQDSIIGLSVSREIGSQTQSIADHQGQAWSHSIQPRHSIPVRGSGAWYMMSKASHKDALLAVRYDKECSPGQASKLNIVFGNPDDGTPKWLPYETSFGRVSSISIAGKYAL